MRTNSIRLINHSKTTQILRKLKSTLPRPSLTIYKSFIRPHHDYGDIIYDQAYNSSFQQKLKNIQYNAALVMAAAINGKSKEKLFEELGLESGNGAGTENYAVL